MESYKIKEKLMQDEDLLIQVLEHYGFANIKKIKQDEIRCGYSEDSNSTSVAINLNNLYCTIFSKNVKGDLYTILQYNSGQSFKQVNRYLSSLFNDEEIEEMIPKKKFCNGFFHQFIGAEQKEKIYDEATLKAYISMPCIRFIEDNISSKTQRKFEIGYDYQSHRITIPWRSIDGSLIGVSSRNNNDESDAPKYLALKSFKKSNHLYGMFQNYNEIVSKRKIIIVESEKSVLQAQDMGIKNVVAVGCHSISDQQILLLKYSVDMVTIMFDKDVQENEVRQQCKKIKDKLNIKVFYCIDKNNLLEEKDSVTDKGVNVFMELCKQIKEYKEVKQNE